MQEFHEEDEEYFCRFTFGQFVSLALLEILAFIFIFYLGGRYGPSLLGRETHQSDFKELAANVEPTEKPPRPESVKYTYPEMLTQNQKRPAPPPIVQKPAEKADLEAMIQNLVKSSPNTGSRRTYSVQIGSYQAALRAVKKVNFWQSRGYDAFLSIGEIPNKGTWYRVRVGQFDNRKDAKKFLQNLEKREDVSAIVVKSKS